ncbi:MAG: 2-phosphosulfolactate phosphatase [Candidatus Eisenbacteria bacterium]|uniref:Probable 2-phosphosulfolactate phosphatase n=1 Tax=Eiseniibacteriota bacterium TaxID=2212470 RepID=A0A9D6QJU6_UNCEI|nr:2-phosphosulfolactate phosphatase [Candidatus Eisenbacteria bacterium]MBI3539526.1 2-phosphosulfolactate phosphatase [Candidatus Eisenbacteria bacterium]
MRVSVLLTPAPVAATCAIVVDVLRATTTLTVALANGARDILPTATTGEALALRASRGSTLACGEREGLIVAGFDLGNSPFEYTRERVAGKTLAFASTNGSQAMLAARAARRRVLAAFVNAAAVVDAVAGESEVAIVCAGKVGGFSVEDACCAGLLVARLEGRGGIAEGAAARFARAIAPADAHEVRALVEGSAHARYLASMGEAFARDVAFCAGLDSLDRAFAI